MTSGPETRYIVRGGNPLQGTVFVQGAKNAALKMIAASLLAEKGRTVLRNVPVIEDVRRAVELAQAVGADVRFHEAERTLVVDASELTSSVLPAEIARRFRASVLFVPALLHRLGEATIEGIGGCNLGTRTLDVLAFLTKMGARITGGGTGFVTVEGVSELTAVEHTVMADRIDAGVFAMAAAITGGEISLVGASLENFGVARWKLEQMGVDFDTHGAILQVCRGRQLRPINVITDTYPGFATDLQSPIMTLSCLADGTSYIRETIFDGRYMLAEELNKMGAKVEVAGDVALVHGPTPLHGAEVIAHDLRCGIALILAGLAADGETVVAPGYLIDRGHASVASRLTTLGAEIVEEVVE